MSRPLRSHPEPGGAVDRAAHVLPGLALHRPACRSHDRLLPHDHRRPSHRFEQRPQILVDAVEDRSPAVVVAECRKTVHCLADQLGMPDRVGRRNGDSRIDAVGDRHLPGVIEPVAVAVPGGHLTQGASPLGQQLTHSVALVEARLITIGEDHGDDRDQHNDPERGPDPLIDEARSGRDGYEAEVLEAEETDRDEPLRHVSDQRAESRHRIELPAQQ